MVWDLGLSTTAPILLLSEQKMTKIIKPISEMNDDELWVYWCELPDEWKQVLISNASVVPLKFYGEFCDYDQNKVIKIFQQLKENSTLNINQSVTNIECLSIFTHLITIIFDDKSTKIEELSPLLSIPDLTTLSIANFDKGNLDVIKQLTKLTNLTIYGDSENTIGDLEFLRYTPNLNILKLSLTKSSNINGLKYLNNLEKLELNGVDLFDSNIETIFVNENLKELSLINCIFDLSDLPFERLKNLQYLTLSNGDITDISPLGKFDNLSFLSLENNKITDISILSNLKELSYLNLSNNKIKNINSLSNLNKLNSLFLKDNQITDIYALYSLKRLSILEILSESNKIDEKDLFALSENLPDCTFWL